MKTINENRDNKNVQTDITRIDYANLNWNNQYHVREIVRREVENINDGLMYDYNLEEVDFYDALHEIIDGLNIVFTHYCAQKIAIFFDVCPFSESPITGEKYSSWNQIAYEVVEQEFLAKYGDKFTS